MSFNSLMALIVAGSLEHLAAEPSVIEFGNQTLTASDDAFHKIIERLGGNPAVNMERLRSLASRTAADRGAATEAYYKALGFRDYVAIDVNDTYGSIVMDLNKDIRDEYAFDRTFSLVTNNGTGEHVFNQDAIFRNAHNLTEPGGIMIHIQPFVDYINHGFYSFHPNLFHAVALANEYDLIALGCSDRNGKGIIAMEQGLAVGKTLVSGCTNVALGVLLSKPKPMKAKGLFRPRQPARSDAERFSQELDRLGHRLLSFCVMRKNGSGAFRTPIQTIYRSAVADDVLRDRYGLNDV